MKELKFTAGHISDQKRLVRGEQLLLARTQLRARDFVHHAAWRVLIVAGGAPAGEIKAIRELMPKGHITAVDIDEHCLSAALDAGVDEVVHCDLFAFSRTGSGSLRPAPPLAKKARFDLAVLDVCAIPNPATQNLFKAYRHLVKPEGVYLLTFAYGRDVIEAIELTRVDRRLMQLTDQGCSERLVKRIAFLTEQIQRPLRVTSVMAYRGHEMPMCSVLLGRGLEHDPISFVNVEPGDFELAVVYPDAASLYDCPQYRIEALRRRFAARKRVEAHRLKTARLTGKLFD